MSTRDAPGLAHKPTGSAVFVNAKIKTLWITASITNIMYKGIIHGNDAGNG